MADPEEKRAKVDYSHACPEWDFMPIHPGDPEFEACICAGQLRRRMQQPMEWKGLSPKPIYDDKFLDMMAKMDGDDDY